MISELLDLETIITDTNESNSDFDSKINYTTDLLCNYTRNKKQHNMGFFNICKVSINNKSSKSNDELNLIVPVKKLDESEYFVNKIIDNISDLESEYETEEESDSDSDSGKEDDNKENDFNELDIKLICNIDELINLKDSKYYN